MQILFFIFSISFAHASQLPVHIGDTTVIIHKIQYRPGKSFIHLHQNETTALKAALAVIKKEGGSVLTLEHPGARNIVFHVENKRYEFDPNRIFTDVGIKKTLSQFGSYSPKAHAEVNKLSSKIKAMLPKGKIIAVHNNRSYSLKDYFPGRDMAADAKALNVKAHTSHRNFYLVTKLKDYLRLKNLNFNSILQSENATDDGSLSVYLAKNSYINVEAGYGELRAQINMLKLA